ncbi:uncharacterized protein ATC70_001518 [Mucor velutinosus]|uniref:Uncharacterized protein n=1 Tax=Mucor velutinosus TaxID=708070 RepID=A0AAN7I2L5_9FUNG|nr:hypothetical protein ATC70_001518 [Mucor velutinosus]
MSDPNFEALANVPAHISSFSASASDGNILQSTSQFRPETGLAAYQLLSDASLLGKSTPEIQQDKLKRITVTFPTHYHAFTVSNDTIYGIERTNNSSSQ